MSDFDKADFKSKVKSFFDLKSKDIEDIMQPRSSLAILVSEAENNFSKSPKSIWSGVMCIMAGIDLCAKFYSYSDALYGSSNRFKTYLKQVMKIDDDMEVVYQLRNALFHSFGLYSKSTGNINIKEYFFHPRYEFGEDKLLKLVEKKGKAYHYKVRVDILKDVFIDTLPTLEKQLLNAEIKDKLKYIELYSKYGTDKPLFEGDNYLEYCGIVTTQKL